MRPTQIEQTGKKYKALIGIGGLLLIIGFVMMIAGIDLAALPIIFGMGFYLGGRIAAWWNHG